MRVCLLADVASVHTQRWAAAYAARGHDVHVLSIRAAEVPGVCVHTACVGPLNSSSFLWTFLSYAWLALTARWRLRRLRPDVVHAHFAATYGAIAALCGARPLVLSVWGSDVIWDKPGHMSWYRRWSVTQALAKAHLVCSTSRFMADRTQAIRATRRPIEVVPFGVDCDQFSPDCGQGVPRAGREISIGFVKTLRPKYAPDVLIRAMAKVVSVFQGARLTMAGRGPMEAELRRLACDLGLNDHVEFVGFVPHRDVPGLMRTFDVFVNCSLYESFGVAILEASACGVPVVATDVGGVSETCRHGETGLMVPPGDEDALAEAIIRLARDPALRAELGRAGRRFVLENYAWQDNVAVMLHLLERVVERRRGAGGDGSHDHEELL